MFKKFKAEEDVVSQNLVKSSIQKAIRTKLVEQYPNGKALIETRLLDKKQQLILYKCHERISLVTVDKFILFFNQFDDPYFPSLRLIHHYPNLLPKCIVDQGAISHILQGANIMAPGLVKPESHVASGLEKGSIVAIFAHGKEHALAVGKMLMSSTEIHQQPKGHAIENVHYLGDPLWKLTLE